jgi:hypothetical protein
VREELAEPEFTLEEPAEGPGAAGRADAGSVGLDVRLAVSDGVVFPVT